MSACRSCGARITWLETAGGGRMPVDEDPTPEGNVVVVGKMAKVCKNAAAAEALYPGQPRYLSHFVTCPQAGAWRNHRKENENA
ncbi:MAG: hypothetical protein JW990_00170 [Thermoleophilia bacterium]|nr:hypothetical protein [Thermoleophilia bacterium]